MTLLPGSAATKDAEGRETLGSVLKSQRDETPPGVIFW